MNISIDRFVIKFFWFLSFVCSFFAIFYYNSIQANSAIQQAALACVVLVIVILPYCLARSITEMSMQPTKIDGKNLEIIDNKTKELLNVLSSILEIQKITLIDKNIYFDPHFELTYESVSEKIEYLKLLSNKKLISQEEFEQHKTKLLTKLKDHLNKTLKPNEPKV